jgi:hypothetical protein
VPRDFAPQHQRILAGVDTCGAFEHLGVGTLPRGTGEPSGGVSQKFARAP